MFFEWKKVRREEMGNWVARWQDACGGERDVERLQERRLASLEQKMGTLEERLRTTDEANQRLYKIWSTVEERFQHQQQYQRALESRLEALSFDHCEDVSLSMD
jgi:hypothetical protein